MTKLSKEDESCSAFAAAVLIKLLEAAGYPTIMGKAACQEVYKAVVLAKAHAVPIEVPKPVQSPKDLLGMESFPTADLGFGIFPEYSKLLAASLEASEGERADAFSFTQVIGEEKRLKTRVLPT